jgi:hypothetical protein
MALSFHHTYYEKKIESDLGWTFRVYLLKSFKQQDTNQKAISKVFYDFYQMQHSQPSPHTEYQQFKHAAQDPINFLGS